MKCGNIECEKETENNKKYCSYRCRNIYVNKHIRDYSSNSKYKNTVEEKLEKRKAIYYENPKICQVCMNPIIFEKRRNIFCGSSCATYNSNLNRSPDIYKKASITLKNKIVETGAFGFLMDKPTNMKDYCVYRVLTNFNFDVNYYPTEFDINLIEQLGWYKTYDNLNLNGVSMDHIYSVRSGYDNNINPYILSHPANCRIITQRTNSSKGMRCDITIDELLEKIKIFDNKYGKYYINDIPTYITTYDILKEPIFISYTEKNEKIQPKI